MSGVFLRLDNHSLAWIQFKYERGSLGHMHTLCPLTNTQATYLIHTMLNRARHLHDVSLLIDDFFLLNSLVLHANRNSNLNRTTCILILWTVDEMEPSSSNDSEDTESDQNGSGDEDSRDGSFGNEHGASHNSDDMDDPNDEDVEMENQQQDEESSFGS
ncbi:hypothetical protein Acr_24g0014610 [Actinidia rufa]|uniref:Uncharacterized protein n=1 Tax=Actinidia rufa TaxID=165716 RepID=A0A7J0GX07_9ERIC|nr:hypothetical protein Acr_24g0014610 [Actinidia rufa]